MIAESVKYQAKSLGFGTQQLHLGYFTKSGMGLGSM